MKRKLKILGLSYAQSQQGSYVVVLSETKGNRKLPIVIKPSDAQQIALKIEGVKSPRPLTHDLVKEITDCYSIDIQEVYIYSILEGVFYTRLVTSNGLDTVEVECTAGDGIALSIVYDCNLYASEEVLRISGIEVDDDGSNVEFDTDETERRVVSIEDLEHMIDDALSNEEYEIAAEIRDRIAKLKEKEANKK